MNNSALLILLGVLMAVVSLLCANSVQMFRATVCIMLLVANIGILALVAASFEVVDEDDEEKKIKKIKNFTKHRTITPIF